MAEPFGIASGAVSIAAVFTTCVDCFGYVQSARHFDRDFQTEFVYTYMLQNRLSRWGEAVAIYDDPRLGNQELPAKTALMQILALFEDSVKKTAKYAGGTGNHVSGTSAPSGNGAMTLETLSAVQENMLALTTKRTKGTGLLKKMGWSLYDKKSLNELNTNIGRLLDGLEGLVPTKESRVNLAEREIKEMKLDQKSLETLTVLSEKVDSLLHDQATRQVEHPKTFGQVNLEEEVRAHNGPYVASDFQGDLPTGDGGCTFGEINAKGKVRLHNGMQAGGKSVFDD
ncbi:hypothetical protein AA0119_g6722 [Alternaria tenuissima]|jgi:hypothetical protein|uniref:Prion-inhibition and propagation HeLo domain-containing protein n=1 Tax=Alternaria tenuissima TaxID=119927 RepID=A0ABY0G7T7_9PLEO|nr:hypothetical protein AA0119_g6722 [Alternaria tenuissima]RYO23476.1 hypothetical protein AA0121_g2136 [Alternaria tenuissima]